MKLIRPRVGFGPADRYAGDAERIMEFSGPGGGGLVSIRTGWDEVRQIPVTIVDVYRTDDTVRVYGGGLPGSVKIIEETIAEQHITETKVS